jgi:3-deoxy-D-manno-octulosonic-acid transferase
MRRLLDAVYLAALLVASPWLLWRWWRTGRYRQGLRDKLLGLARDPGAGASDSEIQNPCPVWFHAVSVGEVHVLRQLVGAFRRRWPDRSCVVSSTTDTGLGEAARCFPDLAVFPFPFDFSWAVERTLRRVRPSLVVLAESELWPNFVLAARRLRIPLAVVNGRMSPRSFARYRLLGRLVRWLFSDIDLFAAQEEEYAAGVLALGGRPGRVGVTGNIKYDGALTDPANHRTLELRALLGVAEGDLVLVAGSTQAPEEELILRVYRKAKETHPSLRLFVAPRQRDRFDEVAALLEKSGEAFVRRSRISSSPCRAPVILVDTIGELGPLWGLADVAFVGGSLDGRRGGQNMIEPAAFGAAVVFGPHVWNFKEPARRLVEAGGAYRVADGAALQEAVVRLLRDEGERRSAGKAARAFVLAQQGATERTLDLLGQLLALHPAQGHAA